METNFLDSFYRTLKQGEEYYLYLIQDYINCRSYYKNQVIFKYRDRGNKYNLTWDFLIAPMQAEGFINRHSSEISFYKTWLCLKTHNTMSLSDENLSLYIEHINKIHIFKIAQHNSLECYGICMILFELLNRVYINQKVIITNAIPTPYSLIRLATLYALTYSKYHIEYDVLKGVDILSNFARMQDYFGSNTILTLSDAGQMNFVITKFIYIWAMYKAFTIWPMTLHYHTNARMMHQNQTVGGVTKDAFETSFEDCCLIGENNADKILQKYEEDIELKGFLIEPNSLNDEISIFLPSLVRDCILNEQINYMQFLNKSIQIEKYDGKDIVKPTYIPAPIHYSFLLKKIGLNDNQISSLEIREDSNAIPLIKFKIRAFDGIFGESIHFSFITYCKLSQKGIGRDPKYRDIVLMVDENKNLVFISLVGDNLYPIKKDIDWTGLFYGVPCKVVSYDFPNKFYEDHLLITVFGISEDVDNSIFNNDI